VSSASAEAASIYSAFLRSSEDPPSAVVVDIHEIGYEYTLAGARACSETSAFVAFDHCPAPLPERRSGGRTNQQVIRRLSKRPEQHQCKRVASN
jgi:hypothetical protein